MQLKKNSEHIILNFKKVETKILPDMVHDLFENCRVDFQIEIVVFWHYFPAWQQTGFKPSSLPIQKTLKGLSCQRIAELSKVK